MLYTASAHTTGGRESGASRTNDGRLDVEISPPGATVPGTNPEQLFAGLVHLLPSAIKIVAARMKVQLAVAAHPWASHQEPKGTTPCILDSR